MEGSSSQEVVVLQVAPFVSKTYEMVSDPRTDALIRWGRDSNSFLVHDPPRFSHLLLPSFFKHSNFSSFIRQLNTYGFRKVDPDRWEFAHESFLRGQVHLLPLIVRKKKKKKEHLEEEEGEEEEEEEEEETLIKEVGRLRREQKAIEEELDSMSKRLMATERRPRQMASFLIKVAEDPELLPRLVLSKKEQRRKQQRQQQIAGDETIVRASTADSSSLRPLPQSLDQEYCSGESETLNCYDYYKYGDDGTATACSDSELTIQQVGAAGSQVFLYPEFGATPSAETIVAHPFSLLGHMLL
ncbi:heat stress transcription factor C-1b-like [Iris pallida]|uniref:Heat stress transcription factor C-1b-like n=1 Tax=Iris pallida TaxID=29817 RepID=A0AAX6FAB0_IRIPA|nr:heat stress transcription factor C-1b-like [Iris pallida]